jgi:hypothetical protein
LSNSKNLITAATKPSEGFADNEDVMHESPDPPGSEGWNDNLATGKGVFMRLVTRFAHRHNFFADSNFEKDFKQFVNLTAQSAWCSCDKTTSSTAPNWNPGFGPVEEGEQLTSGDLWPQVHQTNGLDALNAAVQIRGAV